jgi:hypothetical protein
MHEFTDFPCIPFGKIKQFGEFGPPYQVGRALRRLPDDDWLVEITLIQTGDIAIYRLSRLNDNPVAY